MFNLNLHDECLKALGNIINQETEDLSMNRIGDFGDYRYHIGRIAGLRDAFAALEETREKLQGS